MPTYDYVCASCGQRVEVVHGIYSPGPERCEHCGKGPMRKVLTSPTIHFKGTGWAKKERTASRSKASSAGEGGGKDPVEKAVPSSDGGGDGPSTETAKPREESGAGSPPKPSSES